MSDGLVPGLYLVSLPIGNREDISSRARDVLSRSDVIAAEDTRKARQLFKELSVNVVASSFLSVHEHNEVERANAIIQALESGQSVALVSDAGTPLVSDPGYVIVNRVVEKEFDVFAVPGPCAVIAALTVSGLPTDRFYFEGFLPTKGSAKDSALTRMANSGTTAICYESPKRILHTLERLVNITPDRRVAVVRDITKSWESVYRGSAQQVMNAMSSDPYGEKGEMVLLVEGKQSDRPLADAADALMRRLVDELPPKSVAKIVADVCGGDKQTRYRELMDIKSKG